MKPTPDSRRPEKAARSTTAFTGGNGTQEPAEGGVPRSGAPRSWKEYIEQSLPAQDTGTEAGQQAPQQTARVRQRRSHAGHRQAAPDMKAAAAAARDRFARWAGQAGRGVLSGAAAAMERLGEATADGRERLAQSLGAARGMVARHPISPLMYATVLAVVIGVVAFKDNYARAYVLEVNGQEVGLVSGEDEVNAILDNVEIRAASILGDDFNFDVDVTLSPVYAAAGALSDAAEVENALFMEVGAYMQAYAISVDGEELGYAADKDEFYRMLDEIAQPYIPTNAVRYQFVEDVQVYPVQLPSNTEFNIEPIRAELSALRVEEAVYTVEKGDTFNAIAYSLDMMPNELSILNPDVIVDKLWIGQELVIQQAVPRLSVLVFTDEAYEQVIPSPVEYIETADLYVGDTKVKEQGEDGLAWVNAQVTYLNNVELEREILESTTLKEPTTTYTYTGTTPRPVTASNGYFIWPVRGHITSNFGGRNLWGRYDFHLGIDIAVPYGTAIKAADGGTVIKAGWNGSYGKLVAIRHDNGIVTYYGHNSSILVNVGDKVYQGQIIARAGSTGNSSGNHCHFEVRVEGTSVNPRNYLS